MGRASSEGDGNQYWSQLGSSERSKLIFNIDTLSDELIQQVGSTVTASGAEDRLKTERERALTAGHMTTQDQTRGVTDGRAHTHTHADTGMLLVDRLSCL